MPVLTNVGGKEGLVLQAKKTLRCGILRFFRPENVMLFLVTQSTPSGSLRKELYACYYHPFPPLVKAGFKGV